MESGQKGAQIPWTAAGNNIEDPVVLKITEGGGKTLPLVKGVLVDTENPRALKTEVSEVLCLGRLCFSSVGLDFAMRGSAQQFPPSRGVMGARSPHSIGVSLIC